MRRAALLGLAVACLLVSTPASQAAFPGANGKLVFERSGDVWTANPDGSGATQLTSGAATDTGPRWSPDGKKIAFLRQTTGPFNLAIWVMDADGTDQAQILDCASLPVTDCVVGEPAWSPDGSEIAWGFDDHCGWGGLWIADADGTNPVYSGCPGDRSHSDPAWSPDGEVIASISNLGETQVFLSVAERAAFSSTQITNVTDQHSSPDWAPSADRLVVEWDDGFTFRLITMNRDGTNRTPVRVGGAQPVWSPDGTRIAFVEEDGIRTMDTDGSDETFVTAGVEPDWQPIPVNAYPRPVGASPLRVSLVTAYDECTAPNRTHGPPLGFDSCNPPTRTSDHLTVGTADSNGQVVRFEGHVRLNTIVGNPSTPGDQADVAIDFFSKGALTNGLANYTGELRAEVPLQITDKDNTPHPGGPGAATTQDFTFDIDASCAIVPDPSPHSECHTTTTADALIPGAIKEGRRSIWQLGQVVVYDGGADGDTATADNTVFARQGVFIP